MGWKYYLPPPFPQSCFYERETQTLIFCIMCILVCSSKDIQISIRHKWMVVFENSGKCYCLLAMGWIKCTLILCIFDLPSKYTVACNLKMWKRFHYFLCKLEALLYWLMFVLIKKKTFKASKPVFCSRYARTASVMGEFKLLETASEFNLLYAYGRSILPCHCWTFASSAKYSLLKKNLRNGYLSISP